MQRISISWVCTRLSKINVETETYVRLCVFGSKCLSLVPLELLDFLWIVLSVWEYFSPQSVLRTFGFRSGPVPVQRPDVSSPSFNLRNQVDSPVNFYDSSQNVHAILRFTVSDFFGLVSLVRVFSPPFWLRSILLRRVGVTTPPSTVLQVSQPQAMLFKILCKNERSYT